MSLRDLAVTRKEAVLQDRSDHTVILVPDEVIFGIDSR